MSVVRIAVTSTPLTATLEEAVPAAIAAVEEAGRQGAQIVCLPETALPGHRSQRRAVPDYPAAALEAALAEVVDAVRTVGIVTIVGLERPTPAGREIVAVVLDTDGSIIGVQPKTQIDPTEEPNYVAGSGRRVFSAAGLTFGVATCHEAFRYPEISRSLAVGGAQVIFAPHYVTTDDGSLPHRWCDPSNPFHEKALLCRAMENTVFVAAANVATPDQGSISGIIAPDGRLVASLPYGQAGVVAADIELDEATRRLALRWAPERNLQPAGTPG